MYINYFSVCFDLLHLDEQHEQDEQLQPQELFPFLLLIIRKVITVVATKTVIIIVMISNSFILVIPFLFFWAKSSVIEHEDKSSDK